MPNYRYRALNSNGELVSGAIAAPAPGDVAQRIERLGLVLVDNVTLEEGGAARSAFSLFNKPKAEDVTIFTRDLALLLRAGARINDGLELLAADRDFGRLRPVVADIRSRVVAGESFAEALARHEGLFPPMYVALIRVGEASGSLDQVLEVLADERTRTEALKRRLGDAIRYPLFVLGAAGCVLLFFLTFVLPQFASVLQDFGAKVDPFILAFLNFSTFLRANSDAVLAITAAVIAGSWLLLRQESVRRGFMNAADPAAGHSRGDEVLPHLAVLPESRAAARQRRQPDDDAAHPRRHDVVGRVRPRSGPTPPTASAMAPNCRMRWPIPRRCRRWRCGCCGSAMKPGNCRCWRAASPNSTKPSCSARSIAWSGSPDLRRSSSSVLWSAD